MVQLSIPTLYTDLERSLADLRRDPSRIAASRAVVEAALGSGRSHYGVNTGFGALATRLIPPQQVVQLQTFARLLRFDELGLVPVVPSRGSVGASGDLAPLAHLALPLIGRGEFWDSTG